MWPSGAEDTAPAETRETAERENASLLGRGSRHRGSRPREVPIRPQPIHSVQPERRGLKTLCLMGVASMLIVTTATIPERYLMGSVARYCRRRQYHYLSGAWRLPCRHMIRTGNEVVRQAAHRVDISSLRTSTAASCFDVCRSCFAVLPNQRRRRDSG